MVVRRSTSASRPAVAEVFTTAVFRALADARPGGRARKVELLAPLVSDPSEQTLAEAFEAGHNYLRSNYRNEYLYKNTIISKIVFGRHTSRTAAAQLELQMGLSYADVVVFNGTSTTYEIKTELDSFARLEGQIRDYSTRSEHVNVVTSTSKAAAAEASLPAHVGIIALQRNGAMTTIRPSVGGLDRLRSDHLFQMLRTSEAIEALGNAVGYQLDVPSGDAWKRARELFSGLPVDVAHEQTIRALRGRSTTAIDLTSRDGFPDALRALAYGVDLSKVGRERLVDRLRKPLTLVLEG
ncbi:sce7726 family protein [Leifsonia shinshuensis]|uniref:Sce7726 family protein n=1 Tax=Leifsonia shinshuensis TaxID=150026 RepID=A0A7G6YAC4_9MICO|nr:sce7726 family protein [Leifsonia shinshuensis]QNE35439.1 sce7726 family protein [Leifsonia shinshuensis]